MRYGFTITLIAAIKKGLTNLSFISFVNDLKGFFKAKTNKTEYLVSEAEGKFIRKLRWKGIKSNILG